MSLEAMILVLVIVIIVAAVGTALWLRVPKKLNQRNFVGRWKELQKFCRDRSTWINALEQADTLLDNALKRRKYKGDSMGERMVSAQKTFSDNDGAWYAHNLYKKLREKPRTNVKESEMKKALAAYRQALRDLGALPASQQNKPLKVEK